MSVSGYGSVKNLTAETVISRLDALVVVEPKLELVAGLDGERPAEVETSETMLSREAALGPREKVVYSLEL
jgi:hypothetical protein